MSTEKKQAAPGVVGQTNALVAKILTEDEAKGYSHDAAGGRRMSEWEFLCNGGPNGRTVGGTAPSLGKAIGRLEPMMKALGATIGQVQRADVVE